jgi:hypothetical protein
MKNLRKSLGVVAFLFALCTAILPNLVAGSSNATVIDGYEFVDDVVDSCEEQNNACNTDGTVDCRITTGSPILRTSNTPTANPACGAQLKKLP